MVDSRRKLAARLEHQHERYSVSSSPFMVEVFDKQNQLTELIVAPKDADQLPSISTDHHDFFYPSASSAHELVV